jgi:hypothetical protein
MIFHEYNTIFFHIGKTGGSSVENALGYKRYKDDSHIEKYLTGWSKEHKLYLQHMSHRSMKKLVPCWQYNNYSKFTIIRNPWDRMVSAYYYLHTGHEKTFGCFENFVKHRYERWKLLVSKNRWMVKDRGSFGEGSHFQPQIEYTHNYNKQLEVDYILRFETLNSDWKKLCKILKFGDIELPHKNVSKKRKLPYQEEFSHDTRDMVNEIYQPDIDFFKYEFDTETS